MACTQSRVYNVYKKKKMNERIEDLSKKKFLKGDRASHRIEQKRAPGSIAGMDPSIVT